MYKLILLAFKYILIEILSIKIKILYWKNFLKEISLFKFLNNSQKDDLSYFKDENLNEFLKINEKFTKNEKNFESKNKILVDLTVDHHPEYALLNCLIANDLKKNLKQDIVGLINSDDIKSEKIAQSFGIKNFIVYKRKNFLKRLMYFIESVKLINSHSSLDKLINIKYKNIEIGKCAYEHSIRFFTKSSFKVDFYFYLSVAKSIENVNFFNNIYSRNFFNHSVIAETQFIPHKIFFQTALKKKNIVYARYGSGLENYNVRIYKNFRDSYSHKRKYSKKLVKYLTSNYKKKLEKEINLFFRKNKPERRIGFEDAFVGNQKKVNIINLDLKKNFNNKLKINKNNKLNVLILPNVLQDNVLNSEWSLFKSPYDWFEKTLKYIKKINNVNWIVKPHPAENFYREELKAEYIFNSLVKNSENIKFLNEDIHINNIHKFIDLVITYNGSCGYEYSALGIPVMTSADTRYSDFEFTIAPEKNKIYLYNLKNIKKIKKKFKVNKFRAKLFWYMDNCYYGVMRMTHGLLPKMATQGASKNIDWKEFWKKLRINRQKNKKHNNFSRNFLIQQKTLNRHCINLSILKNIKSEKFKSLNDT